MNPGGFQSYKWSEKMFIVMIIVIIFLLAKCFWYYNVVRGLLYRFGMKYDDIPEVDEEGDRYVR